MRQVRMQGWDVAACSPRYDLRGGVLSVPEHVHTYAYTRVFLQLRAGTTVTSLLIPQAKPGQQHLSILHDIVLTIEIHSPADSFLRADSDAVMTVFLSVVNVCPMALPPSLSQII